jgi:hypothetical protein
MAGWTVIYPHIEEKWACKKASFFSAAFLFKRKAATLCTSMLSDIKNGKLNKLIEWFLFDFVNFSD